VLASPKQAIDERTVYFMAQQEEVHGKFALVGEEQTHSLNTLGATVNVISKEDEWVCGGRLATKFEHAENILVLSVDVADYIDGCIELEQSGLLQKNCLGCLT